MSTNYVVVDTNVWIRQFLSPGGVADAAISKVLERYTPVFDLDTFEELRTRLERPKLAQHAPSEEREAFLKRTAESAIFIERTHRVERSRDPDDNKFLGLAMTIGAAHLISGDEHLQEIKHYQGIQIWAPESFLQLERQREPVKEKSIERDPWADLVETGRKAREAEPVKQSQPEPSQERSLFPDYSQGRERKKPGD